MSDKPKEKTERRTISAPKNLIDRADQRQRDLDYPKFSDYIQALIYADAHGIEPHKRVPKSQLDAQNIMPSPKPAAVPPERTRKRRNPASN